MKKRKSAALLTIVCLAVVILIQMISLIKCEILTNKYYTDFEFAYKNNTMLGEQESFKVLECDGETAQVYYIGAGKSDANILSFKKVNGIWKEDNWNTIWSATGSASDVIWPYWWHFIYGGF